MSRAIGQGEVVLSLSEVTLGYRGVAVLSEVTFQVMKGEFIGIIGPNGSGKTTLLRAILGSVRPLSGRIVLHGGQPREMARRCRIGYVPQRSRSEARFPASVREVVLMGLYARIGWVRRIRRVHREQADKSLQLVGMEERANRPFAELSAGEQQRVMIARSLVSSPDLLVLDEPTAAVDLYAQRAILETLEQANRKSGITVLMASHDVNEIVHFCDKVLLLAGKVVGYGCPTEVLTKENLSGVYGDRLLVYHHHGHPHVLVGDFDE